MPSVPHVLLDNTLLPPDAAHIPATSEGFLFGHGVFETIKVINSRPAFLAQHHARLTASARDLDLPYATSLDDLRERILRLISANGLMNGSAKVVLFHSESDTNRAADAVSSATGELILTRANPYSPDTYTRGFRLRTVATSERVHTLSSHKTLNYLANLRAKRAALAAGFDEPLFVTTPAGVVIEGATTNLFAVRDGVVLTPPLSAGPLPGIARAEVLRLIGTDRSRESLLTADDLQHADELFVTNALLGVMPVARIDDRVLDLARAPVTQGLLAAYRRHEADSLFT